MSLLFFFFIIIPSAIIHEYAHGWVADQLGDPTARYQGRLTLNPIAHIDLFGTILMPLFLFTLSGGRFLFAYAKPVPFNPNNLKNKKWGPGLVGLAGPLANLIAAIVFGLMIRFLPQSSFTFFLGIIVYANVLLAVFNLIPIPPLDGSKVLFALLPHRYQHYQIVLQQYGFLLLIFFIFFAFQLIFPIIFGLYYLIAGQPFAL